MSIAASRLEDLLAATATRDRAAFRDLFEATSAKLYGVIVRICQDRSNAEDVLQETYLKIWRRASAFDAAQGRPITWMVAIARNTAIDAVRRRKEVSAGVGNDGRDLIEEVVDPSQDLGNVPELETLRRCLDQLDVEHRRCVVLAYCHGFSREELGDQFERPVGTIKTWLHRGLASLRQCLDS